MANFMQRFRLGARSRPESVGLQTVSRSKEVLLNDYSFSGAYEYRLYDALRRAVPVVDAAICKIIRLTGGDTVSCSDRRYDGALKSFTETVRVGTGGISLSQFTDSYLESLLTYGNAVGEIVPDKNGGIAGLYNGDVSQIEVRCGENVFDRRIYVIEADGTARPVEKPEYVLFTALNPPAGKIMGVSVLRGLPALSSVLMRIYECIGQNYDRIGNVRYAVIYKPSADSGAYAKERAMRIAEEWSNGMSAGKCGEVKDFIAAGDIDIKVIGADNQQIDTSVPVRQLLEQLVSKLSVPPFLLGLSWSTTERMSAQQADILTSELEYYRRLLNPVIISVCESYLRLCGSDASVKVEWDNINLQDEVSLSEARLNNAKAAQLETENIQKLNI